MNFHTCIKVWGDNLLYIGYDGGKRVQKKIKYSPSLWVNSQSSTGYTDLHNNPLQQMDFDTIKEAKEFLKTYEGVENFKVFGADRFEQLFIAEKYKGDIDYDLNLIRTFTIDIENKMDVSGKYSKAEDATAPITLITIHDSKTGKFEVFANVETTATRFINTVGPEVNYREFDNEFAMLLDFLVYWENNYPDVVTGWNTRSYDIVYIINRIKNILGEDVVKRLSPWKIVNAKKSNVFRFSQKREETIYDIYGINELDYMDLYMKYNMKNSESFALDFICEAELGENKIKYTGSLDDLYREDFQKYVEYNIHDVRLVTKLDAKKQFLSLIIGLSYFGKVSSFNDTLGTVRYWEHLIFNHLYHKRTLPEIVARDESFSDKPYEGAYVMDPVVGLHKWVASIDATSLYPSIIRQCNIGSDTHIERSENDIVDNISQYRILTREDYINNTNIHNEELVRHNYSLACNGEMYSNDKQSFLSELMEMLFKSRKQHKNTMLEYKREVTEIEKEIARRANAS